MFKPVYPFTAIVGQDRVKTALTLSAVDSRLGGILITGPKGSGKTTLINALEDILPSTEYVSSCTFNCDPKDLIHLCFSCRETLAKEGELPTKQRRTQIVELPLSATEDGLLGTINAEIAFREGVKILHPGLLGKANQNILFVDEINLLPDHLIDCILDPSVSGWNLVQREGLSLRHPSRFTLIASMNPEEGRLRPQILDRFALKVEMERIIDPKLRTELIHRNLSFEENPIAFFKEYEEEQTQLRKKIQAARESLVNIEVPEDLIRGVAEACSRLELEGLRSDISILKAARALAAFEGREQVRPEEVLEVFDLAVTHRFKEKVFTKKQLRDILYEELPIKIIREPIDYMQPASDILSKSLTPPSQYKKIKRKRKIMQGRLGLIISVIFMAGLMFTLAVMSAMSTLFFKTLFFGLPVESLLGTLTLRMILTHLGIILILFTLLTLFSRKTESPVRYLYMYIGGELAKRIVTQQRQPMIEEAEEPRVREVSGVINIPLYASLRRLYKMIVEKGVKLLESQVGEERKHYKFHLERKTNRRLKRLIGKQSKTRGESNRGRYVSYKFPKHKPWDLALGPTFRAAAPYQRSRDRRGLALRVEIEDIRVKVREMKTPLTIVLLLDMSESMVASLANVRNVILSMRDIAFKKRDRVGLIVFKGQGASTLQNPTTNLNLVVKHLKKLGASDFTPLASGMYEAWRILRNEKTKNRETAPILVIISDGIANIPLDAPLSQYGRSRFLNTAQADVIDVSYLLHREGIITLVINPSHTPVGEILLPEYKKRLMEKTGKVWLEPTELLIEIPKISGGYYYGLGEGGELDQVILTEALGVLTR